MKTLSALMHKTMEAIYVSEQTKDAGFTLEIYCFIFKNHILVSIDGTAERENQADCQLHANIHK